MSLTDELRVLLEDAAERGGERAARQVLAALDVDGRGPLLVTVAQAATMMGCTESTFRERWVQTGEIPTVSGLFGNGVRVRVEDIHALIARHTA